MLSIQQFQYSADNLGYVVFGLHSAVAVDGGNVKDIISFIRKRHLSLSYVTNTHTHGDHIVGNDTLIRETGATYLSPAEGAEREFIPIDDGVVQVHATPGHSTDSVVFQTGGMLLTGDTLFNGTIGNCFTGDLKGFFTSIKKLMAFPPATLIYAGHDYVMDAMSIARSLEPENKDIETYIAKYNAGHVCSTLWEELRVNPYLRFNTPAIISLLRSKGLPVETEFERWESLMSIT